MNVEFGDGLVNDPEVTSIVDEISGDYLAIKEKVDRINGLAVHDAQLRPKAVKGWGNDAGPYASRERFVPLEFFQRCPVALLNESEKEIVDRVRHRRPVLTLLPASVFEPFLYVFRDSRRDADVTVFFAIMVRVAIG